MAFLLNVIVLLTAAQVSGALPTRSRSERIVAFGLAANAAIVGSMLAAGIVLRRLDAVALFPMHIALLAGAALACRQNPWRQLREVWSAAASAGRALRQAPWLLAAVAALAVAYGYALVVALVFPPFTGDAMLYHLPLGVSFVQQGHLLPPELPGYWKGALWAWYPANASLLYAWTMITTGSDALVDAVQWPFALLGAAAVHALGRRLGLDASRAGWCAALYLAVPLVINQTKTCLVDLQMSFFVVACLLFIVAFDRERPWLSGALVAVPAGLALGLKPSALVHIPLLAAAGLAWITLRGRGDRPRVDARSTIAASVATLAGLFLLGGYWYFRNAVLVGEPAYPRSVLNPPPFEDWRVLGTNAMLLLTDQVRASYRATSGYYNFTAGVGIQVVALGLPGAALTLALSAARRRFAMATLAALSFAGVVVWWLLLPASGPATGRYGLPWLAVALVLAVVAATGLPGGRRILPPVAAAMAIPTALLAMPSIGSVASYEPVLRGLATLRSTGAVPPPSEARGVLVIHDFRDAWSWIAKNTDGERIAVVNHPFTYPLYGPPGRWNSIAVLPTGPRQNWIGEVESRGVDLVVARTRFPTIGLDVVGGARTLRLGHTPNAISLEAGSVSHALEGEAREGPVERISIAYRTSFWEGGEETANETGRFALLVNEGELLVPLDATPPEARGPSTAEVDVPAGTVVESVGLAYLERPLVKLFVSCVLDVGRLAVLRRDGSAVELPLDPRRWRVSLETLEERYMTSAPERFEPVAEAIDRGTERRHGPERARRNRVRIYRVLRSEEETP